MRTVLKLAAAALREHPVRVFLTSIATVAATCMVVWVASGYDALLQTFDEYSNKALGRYALSVAPIDTTDELLAVPPEVVAALRGDPAVADVEPMWAWRVMVRPNVSVGGEAPRGGMSAPPDASLPTRRGPPGGGPGMGPGGRSPESTILGIDSPESPFAMLRGRWIDPGRPDAPETVVSANAAQRLGVDLGGELLVGEGERRCRLQVVGILDTPVPVGSYGNTAMKILTPGAGELFVPMALAERIHGTAARISFVGISLKPDVDLTRFRFGWAPRLSCFSIPVQFQEAHDIEEALDESAAAENVQLQAYAATGIAMLVALLVVFCTLNMGVNERIRQFAVLRAVVLTHAQVGMLIAVEGLLLATLGFLGGLGVGQLMLWLAAKVSSRLFHHGAALGVNSILLAALSAYGGALLASLLPAWRATRVRPVDAMAPPWSSGSRGIPLPAVAAGLLLIAVNPLLVFVLPPDFGGNVVPAMAVGFTAMTVGVVLLAPAVVVVVDRLVGPLLARLLVLDPKLLASQLTCHLWGSVGAAVSMTVGLGLFIAIQVWGFTMLEAFIPGRWAPDAMIAFGPAGLPPEEAATITRLPGVDPSRCLPMVVEQPRLLEDLTRSAERASIIRQDNIVIVGLDPRGALGGDNPLLKFEWVEGSPEQAVSLLEKERGCVVPDHFLRETGLKVGDGFLLVPPEDPGHPVRYIVAGAVRLPGWHWQTKMTGLRPRTHRAAALVFADYATVAQDFGLRTASHAWLSYGAAGTDPERLAAAAQAMYREIPGHEVGMGDADDDASPPVRVITVADIRRMTLASAKQWLWIISQLPLVALVVAGFGVLNVILASVQARRWNMGVLRAIGFTRWTLVRLVIAEGLLIGFVACLLSLGFGFVAGWCGVGFAQHISFFGGMHPALVAPWPAIVSGMLFALAISALAALWPAIQAGHMDILKLLQAGRVTM